MKVSNILREVSFHTHPDKQGMVRDGFKLNQDEERDDDVIKIFHYITSPDGKQHFVDHSPYEFIDQEALDMYIAFYKEHNRFPGRKDIGSNGPLRKEHLHDLVDTLHEAAGGTLVPRKAHESTIRRIALQLVNTACKNFDGDRELAAAKQMARDFHKRLVANIEAEYANMKLSDVTPGKKKFSLAENYNEKAVATDDWDEDYAEDTGWSATCPKCGSNNVHQASGDAHKRQHNLHTVYYECEDCGHRSDWKGDHGHIAHERFGHPSKQPHQYHDPSA